MVIGQTYFENIFEENVLNLIISLKSLYLLFFKNYLISNKIINPSVCCFSGTNIRMLNEFLITALPITLLATPIENYIEGEPKIRCDSDAIDINFQTRYFYFFAEHKFLMC